MVAGRSAIPRYILAALLLAIVRVTLYGWLVHRYITHTVTDTVNRLEWLIYPEELVSIHTTIGRINNRVTFLLIFGLLLTLGSFVIASPILLLGPKHGLKRDTHKV